MKYFLTTLSIVLSSVYAVQSHAHALGAHVHGIATLDISQDQKILTINLSSPLDNLIGFEHIAQTDKQKAQVKTMQLQLNQAASLFAFSPAAQCSLQSVKLDSLVLTPNKPQKPEEVGHADLDGEFIFSCNKAENLHAIDLKLFDFFPNLHVVKAAMVTAKVQTAATLTPQNRRISW